LAGLCESFSQTFRDQLGNPVVVHGIKISGMALKMSKDTPVYDDRMASNRWEDAKCCKAQHLPWTDDYEPTKQEFDEMSSICAECPLLMACARYALTEAAGGFYAGVWLPWRTQRTAPHRRAARSQLRAKALVMA